MNIVQPINQLIDAFPSRCFINFPFSLLADKTVKMTYFYSFAIIIMTTNAVFFVATSVIIYSVRTATKKIVSDSFCSDTKRYINRFCDLRVNI